MAWKKNGSLLNMIAGCPVPSHRAEVDNAGTSSPQEHLLKSIFRPFLDEFGDVTVRPQPTCRAHNFEFPQVSSTYKLLKH